MSPPVEIGFARAAELPLLAAIEARAGALFATVGLEVIADDPPTPLAELAALHRAGGVIVARTADRPIGLALVEPIDAGLHLEEMAVDPAWGRRGVGSRLLDFVAETARRRGLPAVTLTTFVDVPWNGPFYARRGFVALGEGARSADLRARVAEEALRGLDPTARVVMRRAVGDGAQVSSSGRL